MVAESTVHIVALSSHERAEQARACYAIGFHAEIYGNYEELCASAPRRGIILAEDIAERGGIAMLIKGMANRGVWRPVIAAAPAPDPHRVVEAIRSGALDYLALPLDRARLADTFHRASREGEVVGALHSQAMDAQAKLARLTARESEVLDLLVAGASNKMIARDLKISPRTVEIHRANMMTKLDARHAADAVRLRLEASLGPGLGALPHIPRRVEQ